jgi:hypothetical protein
MRDRKSVGCVVIVVTVVIVVGAYKLTRPQPPAKVTRENFARIHPGMTRAEVMIILGPPGDYMTGPARLNPALVKKAQEAAGERFSVWFGDEGAVRVDFDASGTVSDSSFHPSELRPSDREER